MKNKKNDNGLYDKLIEYCKSDYYAFHMPGHKRNHDIDDGEYGFNIDITEIDEFDNLHDAEGIIKKSMENASQYFGTGKTYFLVNGSTCGLLAAICGSTNRNEKILIGRNSHKSVYNASELNDLDNVYLYPQYIDEYGINGGYDSKEIDSILKNEQVKVVVLTSPTYEGVVSNIEEIAKVVHKYGGILIVDEAHGAHFGLNKYFPEAAYKLGADIVIESMHKTLPAFTQTALLHISKQTLLKINIKKIEHYLSVFQTSSPSYIFMANMDRCVGILQKDGDKMFAKLDDNIWKFRNRCSDLKYITIAGNELIGKKNVAQIDLSKLVICDKSGQIDGKEMYDILRDKYHLQLEMPGTKYALAISTVGDTMEGFERLERALRQIDAMIDKRNVENKKSEKKEVVFDISRNEKRVSIYEALNSQKEKVPINRAVGLASGKYIYLYPPGIPMLVPGEIISEHLVLQIKEYEKKGFSIRGVEDFVVVKEG